MLDLLGVVDLQEVVAPKFHVGQLLVVLKEVNGEVHLGGGARGWRGREATEPDVRQRGEPGGPLLIFSLPSSQVKTIVVNNPGLQHNPEACLSPAPSFLVTLTAFPVLSLGLRAKGLADRKHKPLKQCEIRCK